MVAEGRSTVGSTEALNTPDKKQRGWLEVLQILIAVTMTAVAAQSHAVTMTAVAAQ